MQNVAELTKNIRQKDRRALSKAVTLIESTRLDHQNQAHSLLAELRKKPQTGLRIGLSGTPGVGKSTFIESFGMMLIEAGLSVAILAVDPSSSRSGGSILGDKTRMPRLSREPNAFIRPSPSRTTLGGVAAQTRNVAELCETAGFDVILIETVGVGQSETMVADMTDVFLLLLAPAGGDELQGVKRGIMERADIVVINKADGDLKAEATRTASEYASALHLMRHPTTCPEGYPRAMTISAIEASGISAVWEAIEELAKWRKETGVHDQMRAEQAQRRFRTAVEDRVMARLKADPAHRAVWAQMEAAISQGEITPDEAATRLLNKVFAGGGTGSIF